MLRTEDEYLNALKRIDQLMGKDEQAALAEEEAAELIRLVSNVDEYEDSVYGLTN